MPKSSSQWSGTPSIRGSSEPVRMILLTFGLVGIHFCWSLESTYCAPYLLSLGLPKSQTSVVFIVGPLSGLLMQPVIGAITDRSTSRFGRRRVFVVLGGVVAGICFFLLAWTKEVVAFFVQDEVYQKNVVIVAAILVVYMIDFTMNATQTVFRSLIVDVLPMSQQQSASAWASRTGGFSSLVNYGIGILDLSVILPMWFPGDTQFKRMTVISVSTLWITTAVTCYSVTERVLVSCPDQDTSIWGLLPSIFRQTFHLPDRVQGICWVQFWAWIGWFPFLFYSSTWVGETYYRYEHKSEKSETGHDVLGSVGRLGSLALLLFSTVNFVASILLPYMVQSTNEGPKDDGVHSPRLSSSIPSTVTRTMRAISQLPKPTLLTVWQFSHLAFAFITVWAPFVRSLAGATFLVGLCGIPWCVGMWAPFSEMGIAINRLAEHVSLEEADSLLPDDGGDASRQSMEPEQLELATHIPGRARGYSPPTLPRPTVEGEGDPSGQLAGIYMGVLNVYTTMPQFIGTFVSWIAFSIFEPTRQDSENESEGDDHRWLATTGVNAISVCFLVGAFSALIAAESTRRLKKIS